MVRSRLSYFASRRKARAPSAMLVSRRVSTFQFRSRPIKSGERAANAYSATAGFCSMCHGWRGGAGEPAAQVHGCVFRIRASERRHLYCGRRRSQSQGLSWRTLLRISMPRFPRTGSGSCLLRSAMVPPDIYRAHPDGTGLERLTNDPSFDDQAALSPTAARWRSFPAAVGTRKFGHWISLPGQFATSLTTREATSGPHGRRTGSGSPYPRTAIRPSRNAPTDSS